MATVTDQELIIRTVYDYFECWYGRDDTRMDRALRPDQRSPAEDDGEILAKDLMLQATAEGNGTKVAAGWRLNVRIGDVCDDIASVTVRSAPYREYLILRGRAMAGRS